MAKRKKKAPETPPVMGRPTKYKPDFHPLEVVRLSKELGKSKAQICAEFDISKECMAEWARVHKDFSEALKRAEAHREDWWTKFGMQLASGSRRGNPTTYIWMSKNIVGWKDKVEVTDYSDTEVVFGIDGVPRAPD